MSHSCTSVSYTARSGKQKKKRRLPEEFFMCRSQQHKVRYSQRGGKTISIDGLLTWITDGWVNLLVRELSCFWHWMQRKKRHKHLVTRSLSSRYLSSLSVYLHALMWPRFVNSSTKRSPTSLTHSDFHSWILAESHSFCGVNNVGGSRCNYRSWNKTKV